MATFGATGEHNLEQLARFLLRAEAVASSKIEGLQVNSRRLARHEARVAAGIPPARSGPSKTGSVATTSTHAVASSPSAIAVCGTGWTSSSPLLAARPATPPNCSRNSDYWKLSGEEPFDAEGQIATDRLLPELIANPVVTAEDVMCLTGAGRVRLGGGHDRRRIRRRWGICPRLRVLVVYRICRIECVWLLRPAGVISNSGVRVTNL
jgi:hypothetical protein